MAVGEIYLNQNAITHFHGTDAYLSHLPVKVVLTEIVPNKAQTRTRRLTP
jgi:hypothetical protein